MGGLLGMAWTAICLVCQPFYEYYWDESEQAPVCLHRICMCVYACLLGLTTYRKFQMSAFKYFTKITAMRTWVKSYCQQFSIWHTVSGITLKAGMGNGKWKWGMGKCKQQSWPLQHDSLIPKFHFLIACSTRLASFPGPTQLSVAYSTEIFRSRAGRAWERG